MHSEKNNALLLSVDFSFLSGPFEQSNNFNRHSQRTRSIDYNIITLNKQYQLVVLLTFATVKSALYLSNINYREVAFREGDFEMIQFLQKNSFLEYTFYLISSIVIVV